MKGKIATMLVLLLLLTTAMVYAEPSQEVDSTSSASTWEEEAPVQPVVKAPVKVEKPDNTTPVIDSVHIVVSGDMMWKIAERYGLTLEELLDLNPQIKNPSLIYAGQEINVTSVPSTTSSVVSSENVYHGLGHTVSFRNGPGKDSEGVQVYSFNIVMASAMFDTEGRILDVYLDGYEVATPNYDGESMPHFSGWPGKEGYNVTDHETQIVTGVSENTPESVATEVNTWKTKRERGDSYHMNPDNEWYEQMDYFQEFFVGKTVAEIEEWFEKSTTAAGRPIKASTTNEEDLAKLAKLTDEEKAVLADVVSGATMSVRDAHGDFLGALTNAFENRVEVAIPAK